LKIRFGYRNIEFPGAEMGELRDCNALLGNATGLRERMDEDGYLLVRGLVNREKVLNARHTILEHMDSHQALTPDTPFLEGVMPKGGRSVQMMGRKGIAHHPDVLAVLEGDELFKFFNQYFGKPPLTFNYKWLRAVGNEQYTGAHYDFVYMGQGSANLHTTWVPFGDTPAHMGTLAMCVGSHNLPSFSRIRDTYGRMDVDQDETEGWFSKDPMEIVEKFGGRWLTTDYYAGDIILFGMHTMHASTTNLTDRFRLSCDIRFQPASEPADKRWVGDGIGHSVHGNQKLRSMEDARVEWGV
jgi:hypothetical protein